MKAIVYHEYGPPEVLRVEEIEKPVPGDNEVLIRIHATTVAHEDPRMRSMGLSASKPRHPILGGYLAGEVERVGDDVTRFKTGDKVYGSTFFHGAYAEYVCLSEKSSITTMPSNMSYEEAAAIPNGGLTALPFLRDKGKIRSGQRVLVNGASGAVGSTAVQIANYYGAEVTGVCSGSNLDLISSIGAKDVIDYTKDDFTKDGRQYDIIFDAVGKSSFSRCKNSLTRRGKYLTTIPYPSDLIGMLWTSVFGRKKVKFGAMGLRRNSKKAIDLELLRVMIEAGKLRAVIDACYPMDQIVEAHRYVEMGHKKGNVVIKIA
jgi:NADPH:quinone reductase-like Zn-dependent oxidoreductase